MEKIGGLVPVNPHSTKIISKKIVKRITGKETQAIRNPICFVPRVIEIWLCSLSEIANSLSTFLVSPRPNSEGNAVESVT